MTTSAETSEERYTDLTRRAVEFVREAGGSATEEALIAFVFGANGSSKLWAPLLDDILSTEPLLERHPDDRWAVRGMLPATPCDLLREFVSIDVETTGLRPRTQRVIEAALIRYRDGEEVERFETLINPLKRIPAYIAKLTGISDDMVDEAPTFETVAATVEEFVAGGILVGHNVAFDIGFLSAELERAGRPSLINERVDTMGLAIRLLPGLRRPSLDRVAAELGLSPRKIHRAGIDAEITAKAAWLLTQRAQAMGIRTLDQLKSAGTSVSRRTADGVGRGRAVLDRSILADIPRRPGVYLMRDAHDRIIYVGKAKNLRDRVSSYYSQPLGYTRKMDGLLESIATIETEVTGSELQALLLESQLIKRFQPRYNTMMRSSEQYPFIRIDVSHIWPRVTLARARRDDGARYFGPFKNARGAKTTVELINDHFALRTCPRSFKNAGSYGAPCLRLDLGQCLGPCVGRASREEYIGLVHQVTAFLDGDDALLHDRLWSRLEEAAEALDYERARKLRNDIATLRSIVGAQRTLSESTQKHSLLLVQPSAVADAREWFVIVHGSIWARLTIGPSEQAESIAARLSQSWERFVGQGVTPVDHHTLDETHILNRWLIRNWGHPAAIHFDPAVASDWLAIAIRASRLAHDEIIWERRAGSDEDDTGEDAVLDDGAVSMEPNVEPLHIPLHLIALTPLPGGSSDAAR